MKVFLHTGGTLSASWEEKVSELADVHFLPLQNNPDVVTGVRETYVASSNRK